MDFLTFKSFISISALIFFYYIGAVIIPLSSWYFSAWLIRKFDAIKVIYTTVKASFWQALNGKQKSKLVILFLVSFLFMELFWRMLFEFLIAYIQMRDALMHAYM